MWDYSLTSPQQTFLAHPGCLLYSGKCILHSSSQTSLSQQSGLLSHHRKLQAQVETLFGLSCELLVGSVCVSLDYPFSAPCLPSPL
uniref:Uncharacterized protein n=1 Tax=Urocitellus parryii TaxID=9999 RepID=A0A8D2H9J3_UROPR